MTCVTLSMHKLCLQTPTDGLYLILKFNEHHHQKQLELKNFEKKKHSLSLEGIK